MKIRTGAIKLRPPTLAEKNFSVTYSVRDTLISDAGTIDSTANDRHIRTHNPATIDRTGNVIVSPIVGWRKWNNLTAGVATFNENTFALTRVADGMASLVLRTPGLNRRVDVPVSRITGQTTIAFLSWVTGSLGKNCADAVDSRLIGKSAPADMKAFSTINHATSSYVRNAGLWCADLDWSGVSVYAGDSQRSVAMISPRHFICAKHFGIPGGVTMRFLASDGSLVTRTTTAFAYVGDATQNTGDFIVTKLDADLPSTVKFYKVLPAITSNHMSLAWQNVPAVRWDQFRQVSVNDIRALNDGGGDQTAYQVPTDSQRLAFLLYAVSGDSGGPQFVTVNGEPIIRTTTSGGNWAGTPTPNHIAAINAAMTSLGGGYQLTTVDLSGFPSF